MVARRVTKETERQRRPATTPEGRENQLTAQAYDLAERQIQEGTASAQVISHFLKLGSTRERLEQQRIAHENELLKAKRDAIESQKDVLALYKEALSAMRDYAGEDPIEEYDDEG